MASDGSEGRRAALTIAGVAILWVLITMAGGWLGWSNRVRALFDLFALAGMGYGLWLTWRATQVRRKDRD